MKLFSQKGPFVAKKQKGFTLLELLVVITLLAILSVGALVAYEGIGDTAQATAASNNIARTDQSIRNYRAVTQSYPDQWDSLVAANGSPLEFVANETRAAFATLPLPVSAAAGDFRDLFDEAFDEVGIEEIQERAAAAATADVEPNLQHNEGAVGTDAVELGLDTLTNFAVLPSFGGTGCSTGMGTYPTAKMATVDEDGNTVAGVAIAAADGLRQNAIHDALEDGECNLVVAFGFGHDAAHSTNGSSVAISTAPTFISQAINPNESYARYIALFHVGRDTSGDNIIAAGELFEKARLLTVLDTEGNAIDQTIAAATDEEAN